MQQGRHHCTTALVLLKSVGLRVVFVREVGAIYNPHLLLNINSQQVKMKTAVLHITRWLGSGTGTSAVSTQTVGTLLIPVWLT